MADVLSLSIYVFLMGRVQRRGRRRIALCVPPVCRFCVFYNGRAYLLLVPNAIREAMGAGLAADSFLFYRSRSGVVAEKNIERNHRRNVTRQQKKALRNQGFRMFMYGAVERI